MTEAKVAIGFIMIVTGGVLFLVILYIWWELSKIGKELKDIAEGLQRLGKSPKKKGGSKDAPGEK